MLKIEELILLVVQHKYEKMLLAELFLQVNDLLMVLKLHEKMLLQISKMQDNKLLLMIKIILALFQQILSEKLNKHELTLLIKQKSSEKISLIKQKILLRTQLNILIMLQEVVFNNLNNLFLKQKILQI
jgi:hypothetical protein